MFRMLVLQSLYNLSDEQVEYQVRDRLSFTRFLRLSPPAEPQQVASVDG
jgi:transposase, IS5 family